MSPHEGAACHPIPRKATSSFRCVTDFRRSNMGPSALPAGDAGWKCLKVPVIPAVCPKPLVAWIPTTPAGTTAPKGGSRLRADPQPS